MSGGYLRRYTHLPALILMLQRRQITLLDPKLWDDSNDSYYLEVYRRKNKLKSVLALCFTEDAETYHHWSVFAAGPAGVCIEFKRAEFIAQVRAVSGVRAARVEYLKLTELRRRNLSVGRLPFQKRYAFQHEKEFRVTFESADKSHKTLDIDIPLDLIARISLSPWLPKSLTPHVRSILWSIDGCSALSIVRSTLISNQEWKNKADAAK